VQPPAPTAERSARSWKDIAVWAGTFVAALLGIGLIVAALGSAANVIPKIGHPDYSKLSTGDVASLLVAGATLLLADFTALLAWYTRRSIEATRREADIAERALGASNRHADIADQTLAAVKDQAKTAIEQVKATNEQARIAQDQLAASWRPLLAEPRPRRFLNFQPLLNQPWGVGVTFVNIGAGPAFAAKALLSLGVASNVTFALRPNIVQPGGELNAVFNLSPLTDGVDLAISKALAEGTAIDPTVTVLYTDIGGERAWRSRAKLVNPGSWEIVDVEVAVIDKEFLKP